MTADVDRAGNRASGGAAAEAETCLEALRAVAAAVPAAGTLEEALQVAVDALARCSVWGAARVHRFDPPGPHGATVAAGPSQLAVRVAATRQPAWVEDLQAQGGATGHGGGAPAGAAFAFPVEVDTELEAVVELFADNPASPSERMLTTVRCMAALVASVVRDGRRSGHTAPAGDGVHDTLSGLGTRALFMADVERSLQRGARYGWASAVLSVDIDGFRRVNDEFGHGTGDDVLVLVARRIEVVLREYDTKSRDDSVNATLGGDRFLLLCEDVPDAPTAGVIAERLLSVIAKPAEVNGRVVRLTASVGTAMSTHLDGAERLVAGAESAMRRAKQLGGRRHEHFSEEQRAASAASAAKQRALATALADGDFRLVYQPKVSLVTDRVVGFEALLRWERPERGTVPPDEFIPLAEATGMIVPIGAWVLREACQQLSRWQQQFPSSPPLRMAMNVSARQFTPDLVEEVRAWLTSTQLAPGSLCLEVTETTVMDDLGAATDVLDALKALGVAISIDDFGTGHSSLAYLHRFPIDEVKIDKSFVDGLGEDASDTAIVAAIVSLAHALGHDVVAEGVETADQLERLRSLGCEHAQGYLLARPLPPAAVPALLEEDRSGRLLGRRHAVEQHTTQPNNTVLVVDDATDVRQLIRMSLTMAGFAVEEAANGADGIAAARRLQPACVVLDVTMPDMTGFEVCSQLRADPATRSCAIVMVTSRAEAADKIGAFSSGADEYVMKPFAPRELVSRLRAVLRRRDIALGTTLLD